MFIMNTLQEFSDVMHLDTSVNETRIPKTTTTDENIARIQTWEKQQQKCMDSGGGSTSDSCVFIVEWNHLFVFDGLHSRLAASSCVYKTLLALARRFLRLEF